MTAGAALALASAAAYGVSDFAGGLLARRIDLRVVAVLGQLGGLVVALAAAPLFPGRWDEESMLWGVLSGLGTGTGMLFLFRGLSRGAMSIVVPVSAVTGVALPVLAGVLWLGERPAALSWAGVAVAIPALWLVSRAGGDADGTSAGTGDALVAGVGIAVQYLALAQSDPVAGIWPVVAGRVAAILALLPLLSGTRERPRSDILAWSLAAGAAAAIALICYLLAGREQLVVIAVVLSSLYPVIPVVLGLVVLGEKLTRVRATGLIIAMLAVGLLVIG
ncbi:EamA family transporter [Nocardia carnea]|uniref:EamA family transporter n=1 Tax=Nocardia carnea TaxID=37328 RepID=UPI0024588CF7|nr:EamA family transporter [Nocardia carnea]